MKQYEIALNEILQSMEFSYSAMRGGSRMTRAGRIADTFNSANRLNLPEAQKKMRIRNSSGATRMRIRNTVGKMGRMGIE